MRVRASGFVLLFVMCVATVAAQDFTFSRLTGVMQGGPGYQDGPLPGRLSEVYDVVEGIDGALYVADGYNNVIRRIKDGQITTFAGNGTPDILDGTGTSASFYIPWAIDRGPDGTLWVLDFSGGIRRVSTTGVVTTVNVNDLQVYPSFIRVNPDGSMYIIDGAGILKRSVAGVITLLAGDRRSYGHVDGTGAEARFYNPYGVAVDSDGTLLVADGPLIRRVTQAGVVTTYAGNVNETLPVDGAREVARFGFLTSIDPAGDGSFVLVDNGSGQIRRLSPGGVVSRIIGQANVYGRTDGDNATALFDSPWGGSITADGSYVVADLGASAVRRVRSEGVTTIAGVPSPIGWVDGAAANVRMMNPMKVAVNAAGEAIVMDRLNRAIRKVQMDGTTSTIAGRGTSREDGPASNAFISPRGGFQAPNGDVIFVDVNRIRRLTTAGQIVTIAGAREAGFADGHGTDARFSGPYDAVMDSKGNIFVTDRVNEVIRKIDPQGTVSTFAGMPGVSGVTDGTGSAARFGSVGPITIDAHDNLYVGDSTRLRKVTPAGVVTTPLRVNATVGGVAYDDETGTLYYAIYSGLYQLKDGTPTRLIGGNDQFFVGNVDGPGTAALFWDIENMSLSRAGGRMRLLFPDYNAVVRVATCSDLPTLVSHPASTTISSGGSAGLFIDALGATHIQWFEGATGDTSKPVAGGTTRQISVSPSSNTRYWARVSSYCGTVMSNPANVFVGCAAPTIAGHPASQRAGNDGRALLAVGLTGTEPYTYQWYRGRTGDTTNPVTGATAPTLMTPVVTETTPFWVRVSNSCGTTDSNPAFIFAGCAAPLILGHPASVMITTGNTATFAVGITSHQPVTYQWYQGLTGDTSRPMAGATSSVFTTPALTTTTAFWVRVTSSCGSSDSNIGIASVPAGLMNFSW